MMDGFFGEVITAMVTPFNSDGSLDIDAACELANFLADNGSDAIVLSGTTGESPTLKKQEKLELFREVNKAVGGKIKIIAGTGSYDTSESMELTKEAEACGVAAIMLVAPYYNRPPQKGLVRHFSMIAATTSLPIMLYNIPVRTGINLEAATVIELSKVENIAAIKEASGDFGQMSEIQMNTPENFKLYSGQDEWTLPMLSLGAVGVVSVASHVVGIEIKKMIGEAKKGNMDEATRQHNELMPIFKALFATTNPILVKAAVDLMGLKGGAVRPPLIDADNDQINKLRTVMEIYRDIGS